MASFRSGFNSAPLKPAIDGGRGRLAYGSDAASRERFELKNPDEALPQSGRHGLANDEGLTLVLSCVLFVLECSP
jgi:hypothetical protein